MSKIDNFDISKVLPSEEWQENVKRIEGSLFHFDWTNSIDYVLFVQCYDKCGLSCNHGIDINIDDLFIYFNKVMDNQTLFQYEGEINNKKFRFVVYKTEDI